MGLKNVEKSLWCFNFGLVFLFYFYLFFRDSIDEGANNFIRTANHLISVFKEDLKKEESSMSRQRMQHLESVTDILNEYLRHVTAIHSKQRAIRVTIFNNSG